MSLSRNPDAPARSAPKTYSSSSNVVSTTTRVPAARSAVIRRVASSPSMRGIRTSISTTSGRSAAASSTASAPSAASPTTVDVRLGGQQRLEPARTSAWSSASRTRVTPRTARERQRRLDAPAAVLAGPASSVPPSAVGPLAHPAHARSGAAAAAPWPVPSSATTIDTASASRAHDDRARVARACRSTFVSASCTIR